MKDKKANLSGRLFIVFCALAFPNMIPFSSVSQLSPEDSLKRIPVIIEAESGTIGSGFSVAQDGNTKYVTTKTNYTGQSGPGDPSRIITCSVAFQDSGFYRLFMRVRVGSGNYDDDSFFAGKGFGTKGENTSDDWVMVNGLASAGFTGPDEVVEEQGTAGSQIWKWVNISENYFTGTLKKQAFFVEKGNLTKTFQIGSREDGLFIDKLAFGKSNLYYTIKMLDNVLPGSVTFPKPDSSNYYKGPPLAKGASKFLGNVMSSDNIFANYWNQITPGNEGKWGSIAGSSDSTQWNWSGLDAIYSYAKNHNLIFKNHTLIWGQQQPSWISGLDQAAQLKYIDTWIRKVGQRYPDMDMVDVVNEPLATHNPPDGGSGRANYKNALGGNGSTGWDWVIKSFELARKYIPKTKLLINDYGIINDNNATTSYLAIINLLKTRGLIDGIGVQGHRFELETAGTSTLIYNLDRLEATGLPVFISEMDLGNPGNSGTPDDAQQLQLYQNIFPVLWDHPGVKGITLWGYLEGEMWQSTCYLVHKDGTWRPAMTWIADYVKNSTDIGPEISALQNRAELGQNFPNPFSTSTNIKFSIPSAGRVSLRIFDTSGKEIATLVNGNLSAGFYSYTWDVANSSGGKPASGIYYYKLTTGQELLSRKMLLIN